MDFEHAVGIFMEFQVTKERIIKDLRNIGVNEGDHLAVALSFKSIGYVKGGPDEFIDALMEAVGPNGTIMMPAFTKPYYIFNYKSTPTYTGLVPEILRKHKDAKRSKHPTNSVIAIGKLAKYLTEGHNENSSAYMPYSRLAEVDGKVLCIGLGDNLIAIRHEAQNLAGLLNKVPIRYSTKYLNGSGSVKSFTRKDVGGCVRRLPELVPVLRKKGLVKDGSIGLAKSILVPAREALNIMTGILKKKPVLNLCNDAFCLWCRELEKRMDLYEEIENPKYFQKGIMVKFIALINWFRLRIFGIVIRFLQIVKNMRLNNIRHSDL